MKSLHPSIAGLLLCALVFAGCQSSAETPSVAASSPEGPARMELRHVDGRYELFKDGEPFYIHGAGLEFGDIERLAEHGANSFRTWRTDNGRDTGEEVLRRAQEAGLAVTMGLEIAREREGEGRGIFGFDYDDEEAVAEQLERIRAEVMQYKDHPALIIWGIGNELNLGSTNPRVWDAVNEISEMIHEIDPNHLTTTMLAGIWGELAHDVKTRAPDLDLISIQMYADIENLPRYIEEIGWDGPFMVTEWGATGHWEVPSTPWGAPLENNSSVKADDYLRRYRTVIEAMRDQCVGSYVFLWGQKQERTPTWYGMFLPTGEETETVDAMHYVWNGAWPENRSPRLEQMLLNGQEAPAGIYLSPGESYPALVASTDPDGDALRYAWEVRRESTAQSEGGDDEEAPEEMANALDRNDTPEVTLTAPAEEGAYRLFVYVYDGAGHAAHANIPFYVGS